MLEAQNQKLLDQIEAEVIRMGGRVKAGIISKTELKNDEEIRVSIRSSRYPSIEVFTLRNMEPADYRLVLVAIPRKKEE